MKRIVALCFVLSMTLFACGSSDPTSSGINALVGPTWIYQGSNSEAEVGLAHSLRFHANNSYEEYSSLGTVIARGQWSIAGNALTITSENGALALTFMYRIEGNTLTLRISEGGITVEYYFRKS